MKTYISLLRGLNVSGQNMIKMDTLRKMYEELQLSSVRTYIQSGNVIFSSGEENSKKLEGIISGQINLNFGYAVSVIVLSVDQLKHIVVSNRFLKEPDKSSDFFYVTFLSERPSEADFKSITDKKQGAEDICLADKVIYLYCPHGYGKTKLSNTFIEKKLKVTATTRNWKTIKKLIDMSEG